MLQQHYPLVCTSDKRVAIGNEYTPYGFKLTASEKQIIQYRLNFPFAVSFFFIHVAEITSIMAAPYCELNNKAVGFAWRSEYPAFVSHQRSPVVLFS
jgi:hypothetical protein